MSLEQIKKEIVSHKMEWRQFYLCKRWKWQPKHSISNRNLMLELFFLTGNQTSLYAYCHSHLCIFIIALAYETQTYFWLALFLLVKCLDNCICWPSILFPLLQVSEEYRLVPDTLYLTVHLIDRFLSENYIEKQKLQLLGVTCMLIAS